MRDDEDIQRNFVHKVAGFFWLKNCGNPEMV